VSWFYDGSYDRPVYKLSGAAGVGKSYVVSVVLKLLHLRPYQVRIVCPTGKAATVLRSRGVDAHTIHKVFYNVNQSPSGDVYFTKRRSIGQGISLIVLDEASMVNDRMFQDLLSFEIPILLVFDGYQLPPIMSTNTFIDEPDIFLTEVMRQKKESGVLELATMIRNGEIPKPGKYKESEVVNQKKDMELDKFDLAVCFTNEDRRILNQKARQVRGFKEQYPEKGEKLICLKNDYNHWIVHNDLELYLVNGMGLSTLSDTKMNKTTLRIVSRPEFIDHGEFDCTVWPDPFDPEHSGVIPNLFEHQAKNLVFLDYGYAVTVHKAQGDSAPNVLVIDDFKGSDDMYLRWIYTATSRSSKRVCIVYDPEI
jgi:exodeoxyribonuclease-5